MRPLRVCGIWGAMTDSDGIATLRQLLVGQYDELRTVLARRLGSEDLANEALQETYLRLRRPARLGAIASPRHYLLTIATNIARMSFRRGRRWADLSELDAALGFADESPNPEQNLLARADIEVLQRAFDELTPRRRQIIFAARVEGIQLARIAERMGISKTLVEKELRSALMFCADRVGKEMVQKYGLREPQASRNQDVAQMPSESCDDDT
jgi:RNA polymerase sigma-70 factor (ECF subfamily)